MRRKLDVITIGENTSSSSKIRFWNLIFRTFSPFGFTDCSTKSKKSILFYNIKVNRWSTKSTTKNCTLCNIASILGLSRVSCKLKEQIIRKNGEKALNGMMCSSGIMTCMYISSKRLSERVKN